MTARPSVAMKRLRQLIAAVREGDAQQVEEAVLQFSRKRRIYAPLALAVGAFVMLFSGLRLLVTNCYITVPAHIVGVQVAKSANSARPGRDKLAAVAVTGAFGAIVCAPPYVIARIGLVLLGSGGLFGLGVALLVVGLRRQAGATGAVKAIKMSAKLLVGQSRPTETTSVG